MKRFSGVSGVRVAQKYIENPFLLDGYKFDLRLYVLLTGCDPLHIFLHREGHVRMATISQSFSNFDPRFFIFLDFIFDVFTLFFFYLFLLLFLHHPPPSLQNINLPRKKIFTRFACI